MLALVLVPPVCLVLSLAHNTRYLDPSPLLLTPNILTHLSLVCEALIPPAHSAVLCACDRPPALSIADPQNQSARPPGLLETRSLLALHTHWKPPACTRGSSASIQHTTRHSRTPIHHPRPWRRRPLRVALSRSTAVSLPICSRASSCAMLLLTAV